MNEGTLIFDGSNPEVEHQEQTKIISSDSFKKNVNENAKKQKKSLKALKNIGFAVGGLGVGITAMGFMPSIDGVEGPIPIPDEPQMATSVDDEMSYMEAFESAREELGPGHLFTWRDNVYSTYSQEEWSRIEEEDQAEYEQLIVDRTPDHHSETVDVPVVIYDEAPVATTVTDDMSFSDAFAIARSEVGPGGVFEWRGNLYGTYYKTEWDSMDAEERHQYAESVHRADLDGDSDDTSINHSDIEGEVEEVIVDHSEGEIFLQDEEVTFPDGTTMNVGYFQSGDEVIMKVDVDLDGTYDYVVDQEAGQLIGLNGNPDVDLASLISDEEASDISEPIMSEYVEVDGYNALVTTFADGSQQAQIDLDGDGVYDTTMTLDPDTGDVYAYDINGDLIGQDNIYRYENIGDDFYDSADFNETDNYYEENLYANNEGEHSDEFGEDFVNDMDVNEWA